MCLPGERPAIRLLGSIQAAIYGLWAWFGSIDYFRWGGLPNELAMLLFLTMLCAGDRRAAQYWP